MRGVALIDGQRPTSAHYHRHSSDDENDAHDICNRQHSSPNTHMPIATAVTGSSAPRIAVGVEPIYCIEPVVHRNDTVVGK